VGAIFNRDETRILSWARDNTARLWRSEADTDFPKELFPLLLEVMTGTTLDAADNISLLDPAAWEARKRRYQKVAEDHLPGCEHKSTNLYMRQREFWGVPQ
jgi:hypothetical protein